MHVEEINYMIKLLEYNLKLIKSKPDFQNSILKIMIYGGQNFLETKNENFLFLKNYNLTPRAIQLFLEFIRYGDIFIRKNYKIYRYHHNYWKNELTNSLQYLSDLETIFQWASLRKYINNVLQEINNFEYNPKNPDEDTKNIYEWQYIDANYLVLSTFIIENKYTLVSNKYKETTEQNKVAVGYYYRRKR